MATEHWWGRTPPATATLAWGARAIYKQGFIDILHDRQSWRGPREDRTALVAWINDQGIAALKAECEKVSLPGDSDATVLWSEGGFTIEASPNASYGYLYITAYPTPVAAPA